MDLRRIGSQPSLIGSSEYFAGSVRIDPLFQSCEPARAVDASGTFESCALAAWHAHPLGQTLIATSRCGLAQHREGRIEEVRLDDIVWFAPGEMYWRSAKTNTAMTHIAIQEQLDGKTVEWTEKVSDEHYDRL